MDILYVKKSYDKLYKNRCAESRKVEVGKNIYIYELIISAKYIDKILNFNNNIFILNKKIKRYKKDSKHILVAYLVIKEFLNRTKLYFKEKAFSFWVRKTYKKNKLEKLTYILSTSIEQDENTKTLIQKLLNSTKIIFHKYKYLGQYDINLPKYIEEYRKNKNIDKKNVKIAMLYNKENRIDTNILKTLLQDYKVVDILEVSKNISSNKINNKTIDNLNNQTGASTSIIDINDKKVKEYNYIIIMDSKTCDNSKGRLNRKAHRISVLNIDSDTFNTNIDIIDKMVKEKILDANIVNRLRQDYGLVIFSKSLLEVVKI